MNFIAQQLAVNEGIQDRLFDEFSRIERKLKGAALDYESLKEMKYMDMVIDEALRLCPITTELKRRATSNYTLKSSNGVEVPVKPGEAIWISIYSLQTDEKYFPNPMRFDPERFNDENKSQHVSGSYAPYGMGPRNCVGCSYSTVAVKIMYYYLCRKFRFCTEDPAQENVHTKTMIELRLRCTRREI